MATNYKKIILIADPHVWPSETSSRIAVDRMVKDAVNWANRKGALGSYSRAFELEHICKAIAAKYDPRDYVVLVLGDIVEGAWSKESVNSEYANASRAIRPLINRGFGKARGPRGQRSRGDNRRALHMVPGNHDFGIRGNEFYLGPKLRIYARDKYLKFHEDHCGYHTTFPHIEDYGEWKLILLDSTGYHQGRATTRSFARGRIGTSQLGELRSLLTSDPKPTVVAMHHHPRMRQIYSKRLLAIEDIKDFDSVLSLRKGKVTLCCGHKHVENLKLRNNEGTPEKNLWALALGMCTDDLRAIVIDPVVQQVVEEFNIPHELPGETVLRGPIEIRNTPLLGSREDVILNDRRLAQGQIITSVNLECLDSKNSRVLGPASKVESGISGARILADCVGTNSQRVTVRTWGNKSLRYRVLYNVRREEGLGATQLAETHELTDRIYTHNARQGSRKDTVLNNRRMAGGCIVEAVQLERLDSRGRKIQGPAREITIMTGTVKIGGAIIVEDAVGTNNLRVVVRTWNGSLTHLRYRLVYTVRRSGNSDCTLRQSAESQLNPPIPARRSVKRS